MAVLLLVTASILWFGQSGAALQQHPFRTSLWKDNGAGESIAVDAGFESKGPKAQWITQPLDHFDAGYNKTWQQRYFVNSSFFDGTGPVFLCVGGEGTAIKSSVVTTGEVHCGLMMTMAAEKKALVFAVEHRYYGESVPTPDLSTKSLQWLSSRQALEDLSLFIVSMNEKYNLTSQNPWVSWGGSYPGMLAAWIRYKYPHLVYAAISSSAPVRAVANYQGYNDVVAYSLRAEDIGGSQDCLDSVRAAFAELGLLLATPDNLRDVENQFNVCDQRGHPLDVANNRKKLAEVASMAFTFQENDMACNKPGCNIAKVCSVMTDEARGQPLDRLADMVALASGGYCVDVDDSADVRALTNTTLKGGKARVWFYQTCTEFGFYQTCDPDSHCPFTSKPWMSTLESWYAQCELAYGVQDTAARVPRSNAHYGGDRPAGSRILFANGEVDPWRAASITTSLPHQPALVVKGASHHQWTHPPKPTDTAEVIEAREAITEQLNKWLDDMGNDDGRKPIDLI
uniref:Thymus-specific serine protease n=1 Tax=Pyramimonas obovata TaxID=1411642 RepID=A0A7S0WWE3_9CHLO